MRFSSLMIFTTAMLLSMVSSAGILLAGSGYKGNVITPLDDGMVVSWRCDGKKCISQANLQDKNMHSCQDLVKVVGKVTYFTETQGQRWSPLSNHRKLRECNRKRS